MKKKFILALVMCLVCFYNISLFAKTNTARKRAATSSKSSSPQLKRAATNGSGNASTRRAAITKRANTLSGRRSNLNNKRNVTSGATSSAESASNICPLGTPIKRLVDENGTETFYSAKEVVCSEPENTNGISDLGEMKQPSWIAGKDIWIFNCNVGYIKTKSGDGESCVDRNTICPLNTIVKQEDGVYYNPLTNEVCTLPLYAASLKLTEETNTNPNISPDEAYYIYCANNHYKSGDIECLACPTGKYSSVARLNREDIIGDDGQLMGQKVTLVEGPSNVNQCLTAEEMQAK